MTPTVTDFVYGFAAWLTGLPEHENLCPGALARRCEEFVKANAVHGLPESVDHGSGVVHPESNAQYAPDPWVEVIIPVCVNTLGEWAATASSGSTPGNFGDDVTDAVTQRDGRILYNVKAKLNVPRFETVEGHVQSIEEVPSGVQAE